MAGDSEWAECAIVSAIMERYKTEWYDDEKNGLLVDMPTEEERGVPAESDGADEPLPGRLMQKAK